MKDMPVDASPSSPVDEAEATRSGEPAERLLALPVTFNPSNQLRLREAALSFILTPIAFVIMLVAINSLLTWTAVGQPLSSPEGSMGLALAGMLLFRIGSSVTHTSAGIITSAVWTAVGLIVYEILASGVGLGLLFSLAEPVLPGRVTGALALLTPLAWSEFPLLLVTIVAGAVLATRVARHQRRHLAELGTLDRPTASSRQGGGLLVLNLAAAAVVWMSLLELAPKDVSQVAVYGSQALGMVQPELGSVLAAMVGLAMLTVSSGWSLFSSSIVTVVTLIIPSMLIFPVTTSLTGAVATPGAPVATSLALAAPLVGALGIVIVCLTWALHWVQTCRTTEVTVSD
ncbi:hypothetical protein [Scrofimicrobium sp. R131]|uniref:Integral membrane protein n=1 Tax=Scrofimicrobium appendicitidis TaxID=3079930 RepID=A0AAU7V7V1_9ACTO